MMIKAVNAWCKRPYVFDNATFKWYLIKSGHKMCDESCMEVSARKPVRQPCVDSAASALWARLPAAVSSDLVRHLLLLEGSEDCHTRVLPRRSRNKAAYCFQLPALRRISHQSAQVLLFLVNSAGSIHQIGSTGSTWGVNHFSKVEAGSVFTSHSLQRISPGRPLQSSLSPGMIDDLTIFDHLKHVWAILASNDSGYFLLFLLDWVNRKRDFSFPGFGKWNRVEFFHHIYDGKEPWLFAGVSEHWKLKTQVFLSVDLWGLRIQARKMPTPNKIKQAILISTLFPDLVCKKSFKF